MVASKPIRKYALPRKIELLTSVIMANASFDLTDVAIYEAAFYG